MFYQKDGYFSTSYIKKCCYSIHDFHINWDNDYPLRLIINYVRSNDVKISYFVTKRLLRDHTIYPILHRESQRIKYHVKHTLTPTITYYYLNRLIWKKHVSAALYFQCWQEFFYALSRRAKTKTPKPNLRFSIHNEIGRAHV